MKCSNCFDSVMPGSMSPVACESLICGSTCLLFLLTSFRMGGHDKKKREREKSVVSKYYGYLHFCSQSSGFSSWFLQFVLSLIPLQHGELYWIQSLPTCFQSALSTESSFSFNSNFLMRANGYSLLGRLSEFGSNHILYVFVHIRSLTFISQQNDSLELHLNT